MWLAYPLRQLPPSGQGFTCPHFVGVWDTVSSVGWKNDPLKLPYSADNPDISIGRHAIAIDERRAFFRTNRWIPSAELDAHGPKDVKQVWFAGVHCDVGGGYPEEHSGLSKFPLEWMLEEAKIAGLQVNAARQAEVLGQSPGSRYAKADPDALIHENRGQLKAPFRSYATSRFGIGMQFHAQAMRSERLSCSAMVAKQIEKRSG
jgi:hypothetical protein